MAQNIDVSIIPQSYLPEIKVSENDDSLRVIRVSIIDENGEAYQIPSGVTATFAGTKPSGLGFTAPCTIDGSAVQFVMEDTVCNEAGRFPAEIRLINGEARIGTCNVLMSVEPNPHPDDTTDGDREPLVNEITALLHAIEEQAEQVAENTRTVEQAMDAWTNMSAEATTLPAGSEASASYSEGVLSLGIPAGPKGAPGQDGQDGVGIASVQLNSDYTLTITLTDGRTYTTTSIRGEQGETGLTPDFTIGTVTTLEPGTPATATITGTDEEPVLNLGIPKGDPGDVSSTGYYPDLYAGGLVTDKGETDVSPYTFRASKALGYRESLNQIVGATVGWNQLAEYMSIGANNGITYTWNNDGSYTLNGTATANSYRFVATGIQANHVGFASVISESSDVKMWFAGYAGTQAKEKIYKPSDNYSACLFVPNGATLNNVKAYPQFTDLTAMLGTSIADHAYSLEQSTPGSGIAWLRSYGFLTKDYYEYCQPRLESVRVSGHETTGRNLFDKGNYNVINGYINDNVIFSSGASRSVVWIKCLPNTTYTISRKAITSNERFGFGWTTETPAVGVSVYGATFMSTITTVGTTMTRTLTTGANAKYLAIWIGWENRNAEAETMQIEFGSTATTYEPYTKHTYHLDSTLTLNGILKLSGDEITADGDVYSPSGGVQRRYGERAYQSGDESLTDAITDGTTTVYKLTTPTTETADPYTQIQTCDPNGTEQFTDYGVASGDRDVAIPVGHSTFYPEDLKGKLEDIPDIPEAPASNGTYTSRRFGLIRV